MSDAIKRLDAVCHKHDGSLRRGDLEKPFAVDVMGEKGAAATDSHHLLYIVGAEGAEGVGIAPTAAKFVEAARKARPQGTIAVADALAQVEALIPKETPCEQCDGKGNETCEDCGGDGECYHCDNDCPECDGNGEVDCAHCKGKGVLRDAEPHMLDVGLYTVNPTFVRNILAGAPDERVTLAACDDFGRALCILGAGWVGIVMTTNETDRRVQLQGVQS